MIKRTISILGGVGCPYQCTFCINSLLKGKYRSKTRDRIIKEIDLVVEKYNIEYVRIEDDIFLLNKKKTEEFLNCLEKRNYHILWSATARANFFQESRLSEEILERIKKLGGFHLSIGVESGSPRMLEIYKKQITLNQVERAAELCNKYDFQANYSFIIGSPHETIDEVFMSLKFASKLKKIHPNATMIFHTFRPQPGCVLFNESVRLGFNAPKSLEEWIPKASSSLRGNCSLDYFPWIDQPKFLEFLSTFGELAFQNMSRIRLSLRFPAVMISILFKLRLKYNFWHLLIEKNVFSLLKKISLFKYIRTILK